MSEVLDFYLQEASACFSSIPWLVKHQKASLKDLKGYGFPSRKVEDWKYTPLDSFLKHQFSRFFSEACDTEEILSRSSMTRLEGQEILILNGQVILSDEFVKHAPQGVLVKPLSVMLREHEALV